MYIRAEPDAPSPADVLCPPSYPHCAPSLSAGPALTNVNVNAEGGPAPAHAAPSATSVVPTLATANTSAPEALGAPAEPAPQSALAAGIARLGKRNFVGIVVLAVLAAAALVLWLSFGKWPRRRMRRLWPSRSRADAVGAPPAGVLGSRDADGGAAAAAVAGEDDDEDEAGGRRRALDEKREPGLAECPRTPESGEVEVDTLEKGPSESWKKTRHVHFA
ncbi:hypothetical protein BD413DRAFT_506956 [Trametes elegans]|nr:hypothetical protein BD413DRAFT_506956 [Trametes elegans]